MHRDTRILRVDGAGQPTQWITAEDAVCLYATDHVRADLGEEVFLFRGGKNRVSGLRSEILISSIVMVADIDKRMHRKRFLPTLGRQRFKYALYRRDQMCMYCGRPDLRMSEYNIDHVIPESRGGETSLKNTVLSCRRCNHAKGDRTPEEWAKAGGRKLLAIPYVPSNRAELLWLEGRRVLADQQAFLMARFKRDGRLFNRLNG